MVDDIIECGPFGDYVSHPSSLECFDQLSDAQMFDHFMVDEWKSMGAKDALTKAHEKVVEILANHEVAPIDADIRKDVDAIIKAADARVA